MSEYTHTALSRRIDAGLAWLRTRTGVRILGVLTLLAAGFALFLAVSKPDPFAFSKTYYAEMDSVKGLGRIDRDIRLAGVNVGHIGAVEQVGDDAVIELVMEQDIPVKADATVRLRPHTLFEGSGFIDLSPGSPSASALEEGDVIPREQTSIYTSLDEATRLLRKPIRESLRDLLEVGAKTLRGEAIEGTQQLLEVAPELMRQLGPTARAIQGEHRTELSGAIRGLSATVRGVAAREERIGPFLASANRTLAALEVDGGEPLDATLAALPGALEELVDGAPSVLALIDRADGLAAAVNPAFADLTPAAAELRPLLEKATPILEDVTPMISDLQIVLAPLADAAPVIVKLINKLEPGSRLLADSVLPVLNGPSRLGLPTYMQLLNSFAGVLGASRPYQLPSTPTGSGHMIRLGMHLNPDSFFTATACDSVGLINPDALVALQGTGLCP
jgi:phospholipid/cholesterol/gamma-HCH transport system substrate-binding protein